MTDPNFSRQLADAAFGQLNPRRFELLLTCIRLGGDFTTADVRAATMIPGSDVSALTSSLSRDLRALEEGGLLRAEPCSTVRRQGQVVRYNVAPHTRSLFAQIAQAVEDAYQSAR